MGGEETRPRRGRPRLPRDEDGNIIRDPATEPAPEPDEDAPRAGGYVDRGDGNGWVLDEEE